MSAPVAGPPETADRDLPRLRVLIVEDDPDDAALSRTALSRAPGLNCDVTIQQTMREAVAYLGVNEVDVVLLDLSLPDAYGMQAVSRLVNEFHRLPVVVLTGMADEQAATRALQVGAEDYLVKGHSDPVAMGRALRYALERKRADQAWLAREAAEAAHRVKDLFVLRMSHELRTPLTAILGMAELLAADPGQRDLVDAILRNGRHLSSLVNGLIDVADIEAGKLALTIEEIQVDRAVAAAVDETRRYADARCVSIHVDVGAVAGARIAADRARLRQVLRILLTNAVAYNRDGGSVTVTGQAGTGGHVRLDICDTGIGISAEQLARLYSPFDRLGAENTRTKGIGLGLFVAKNLVEAMSGRLWHDSTEGSGTCARTEWKAHCARPTREPGVA